MTELIQIYETDKNHRVTKETLDISSLQEKFEISEKNCQKVVDELNKLRSQLISQDKRTAA